eukprot:6976403-Prymnesium_polylepis.1
MSPTWARLPTSSTQPRPAATRTARRKSTTKRTGRTTPPAHDAAGAPSPSAAQPMWLTTTATA